MSSERLGDLIGWLEPAPKGEFLANPADRPFDSEDICRRHGIASNNPDIPYLIHGIEAGWETSEVCRKRLREQFGIVIDDLPA